MAANQSMALPHKPASLDALIAVIITREVYPVQVTVCLEAENRAAGSLLKFQGFAR